VILDNNTSYSGWTGYDLAMSLLNQKEEYPNLYIVTVSSSDMDPLFEDRGKPIRQLKEAGGEFWAKYAEKHLMMLWLGTCLQKGRLIPREKWLLSLGLEAKYRSLQEKGLPEDFEIFRLCDKPLWEKGKEETVLSKHQLRRGDFLRLEAGEILKRLGFPNTAPEGTIRPSKERV